MASGFLPRDRDQQMLLPPSINDWVAEDHAVRFVVEAVDLLDLSAFVAKHPLGGVGRRAYDPSVMVALLFWAYTNGVYSSREIERSCERDLTYRFVTANRVPDHGTIARFRASNEQELKDLFAQVLQMCAALGLTHLGVVALDGTKIAANASKDANRSKDWLDEQIADWQARAAAADAAEDAEYGEARGDEVPADVRRSADRARRMQEARDRIVRTEQAGRRRAPKNGHRDRGPVGNVTDPESGLMPMRGGGFIQGFNAQAIANPAGVALAARVGGTPADAPRFKPMLRELAETLTRAGITEPVGTVVADAGYWSKANAETTGVGDVLIATDQSDKKRAANLAKGLPDPPPCTADPRDEILAHRIKVMTAWTSGAINYQAAAVQMDVSIPRAYELRTAFEVSGPDGLRLKKLANDSASRRAPRGPSEAQTAKHAMRCKLDTDAAKAIYRLRAPTIEGLFGNTKHNRGFRRFSRRGLSAADSEWSLVLTVGNLNKISAAIDQLTWFLAGRPLEALT